MVNNLLYFLLFSNCSMRLLVIAAYCYKFFLLIIKAEGGYSLEIIGLSVKVI